MQETYIRVFRNIHQYDASKPFKPWFYRILLNESRRYMKKQNSQAIAIESEALLDYVQKQHIEENPSDQLDVALWQLHENHRTILVLKYINGFTEREIAEMLQLNINTVKSRLYKARQKLKELIGGEMNE